MLEGTLIIPSIPRVYSGQEQGKLPPAPVIIPQQSGASVSNPSFCSTFTQHCSPTTACLAKLLCPKKCDVTDSPVLASLYVFDPSVPRPTPKLSRSQFSQKDVSWLVQFLQVAHEV